MTKLRLAPYMQQLAAWPATGRHILAQFDDETIVVYQAYRPGIGHFAATHGRFGGEWSSDRMSWVKPNFLWMMYRSGWAEKLDQEVVLAVRLERAGFDQILAACVPSSFDPGRWPSEAEWRHAVSRSDVRLQWDPDHDPGGRPVERRALQLGLRGETLRRYAEEWIVDIEDVTPLVLAEKAHARERGYVHLSTPFERVYPVVDARVAQAVHVDRWGVAPAAAHSIPASIRE
jgi:hypothetical protein